LLFRSSAWSLAAFVVALGCSSGTAERDADMASAVSENSAEDEQGESEDDPSQDVESADDSGDEVDKDKEDTQDTGGLGSEGSGGNGEAATGSETEAEGAPVEGDQGDGEAGPGGGPPVEEMPPEGGGEDPVESGDPPMQVDPPLDGGMTPVGVPIETGECSADECGDGVAVGLACPDGTPAPALCSRDADGQCGWVFPECGGLPDPVVIDDAETPEEDLRCESDADCIMCTVPYTSPDGCSCPLCPAHPANVTTCQARLTHFEKCGATVRCPQPVCIVPNDVACVDGLCVDTGESSLR